MTNHTKRRKDLREITTSSTIPQVITFRKIPNYLRATNYLTVTENGNQRKHLFHSVPTFPLCKSRSNLFSHQRPMSIFPFLWSRKWNLFCFDVRRTDRQKERWSHMLPCGWNGALLRTCFHVLREKLITQGLVSSFRFCKRMLVCFLMVRMVESMCRIGAMRRERWCNSNS